MTDEEFQRILDGVRNQEEVIEARESQPTAQEGPSTPKGLRQEMEEERQQFLERYHSERKRKGNAPVQIKKGSKKARTATTGIVIREQEERNHSTKDEESYEDYCSNEEQDSEDDTSFEDEEFQERQLEGDHRELVHPPVERMVYQRWHVELDDEIMEDMKHYNTEKLQDAFDDKDDST